MPTSDPEFQHLIKRLRRKGELLQEMLRQQEPNSMFVALAVLDLQQITSKLLPHWFDEQGEPVNYPKIEQLPPLADEPNFHWKAVAIVRGMDPWAPADPSALFENPEEEDQ